MLFPSCHIFSSSVLSETQLGFPHARSVLHPSQHDKMRDCTIIVSYFLEWACQWIPLHLLPESILCQGYIKWKGRFKDHWLGVKACRDKRVVTQLHPKWFELLLDIIRDMDNRKNNPLLSIMSLFSSLLAFNRGATNGTVNAFPLSSKRPIIMTQKEVTPKKEAKCYGHPAGDRDGQRFLGGSLVNRKLPSFESCLTLSQVPKVHSPNLLVINL